MIGNQNWLMNGDKVLYLNIDFLVVHDWTLNEPNSICIFLYQDIYNFFEPVCKIYLFLFETQQHKELANWYEKNLFKKNTTDIHPLYSIPLKFRNVKNAYTRLILLYLGFTLNKKPEWLNFSIPIFFFRERRPLNASLVIPHCGLLNAINVFRTYN